VTNKVPPNGFIVTWEGIGGWLRMCASCQGTAVFAVPDEFPWATGIFNMGAGVSPQMPRIPPHAKIGRITVTTAATFFGVDSNGVTELRGLVCEGPADTIEASKICRHLDGHG
jgi:hypothetical protein